MNYGALIQDNDSEFDLDPNKKTVLYIDLNNLFMRAYSVSKAQDLNPIHLILNSLYALKSNIDHHFAFAIGDSSTSRDSRLEIYPEYKGTREKKTPEEELEVQKLKEITVEIMEILGICYHEAQYIEADDVIGILSKKSINQGWNVIAVTSDKDYKQLCNMDNFNLYNSMKRCVTTKHNMVKENELTAEQFLDYLILTGDSSDNIKGVYKVGDKTAKKWLTEFGSLDNIIQSLVREGLLNKSDYITPRRLDKMNDIELMQIDFQLDQPLLETDLKLKNGVTKTNLIEAVKSGQIELNYKLIEFQYQHEGKAIIPREKIVKPHIDAERLLEFCNRYNLNNFKSKFFPDETPFPQYSRNYNSSYRR